MVVDVLRATSAFCAVMDAGAELILPVDGLEALSSLGSQGYMTAAERDGRKVDFADFGNSPVQFLRSELRGRKIAYSTTNGTRAVELAKSGPMVTACFNNLDSAIQVIIGMNTDVLLFCSGWMDSISLEDTVFAVAIVDSLKKNGYQPAGDAALIAAGLWQDASPSLKKFCSSGTHYRRLRKLGLQEDLDHCFQLNTSGCVPFWNGQFLENFKLK